MANDPDPDRYDGRPPERSPLLLASLVPVSQLMANAVTANTGWDNMTVYYFINDHLGTPQKVIDEDGNVVWDADYWPFGEVDVRVAQMENMFRLPGQHCDTDTHLHNNLYRHYSVQIGRFLKPDPIGILGGVNLFHYASNNAISITDPLGLNEVWEYGMNYVPEPPAVGTLVLTTSVAGLDTHYTVYNTDKGLFSKGAAPEFSASLTYIGASAQYIIEDPWLSKWISIANDSTDCDKKRFGDTYDPSISIGLSEHLGGSYYPVSGKISLNLGAAIGYWITPSLPIPMDKASHLERIFPF